MGVFDWLFGRRKSDPSSSPADPLLVPAATATPSFAILDVETTGLSAKQDRVLELAVVRVDAAGHVVDEWVSRFNPEGPVGATHIHGITQADVAGAPLFRDLAHDVAERVAGLPIAAHNAKFDLAFLRSEFKRAGWSLPYLPAFCTMQGSHHYLPNLDRRRLVDCCWAVDVPLEQAHSALGDARATAGLLSRYLAGHGDAPLHADLRSLPEEARAIVWPAGPAATSRAGRVAASPVISREIRIAPPKPLQPPLITQLSGLSLLEVLDEGAPEGTMTYLETLLDVLEDGELSTDEVAALADLTAIYELSDEDILATHRAFLAALAHRALDDGLVTMDERAQLLVFANLLAVPEGETSELIKQAEAGRLALLSAGLSELPADWEHGEPLRVGDKVAFTGCDDGQRERLEQRAVELGVRVMTNVSRLTAMLVTDGSYAGGKYTKALEVGTRIVHPDLFDRMLTYLQPATSVPTSTIRRSVGLPLASKEPPATETALTYSASLGMNSATPAVVRAWALKSGYAVGVRGRLHADIWSAYASAHPADATGSSELTTDVV